MSATDGEQPEQPPPEVRPLAQQPPEEASIESAQASAYAGALTAVHLAILAWLSPDEGDGPPSVTLSDPVAARIAVGQQFDARREMLDRRLRAMTDGGARAGREAAARRHDLDITPERFDRATQRALREMADQASRETHNRQARDIGRAIADGRQAGLTIEEVATRLREDVLPDARQWEARRTAKTEIHAGAERGKLAAFREVGVGDLMWLSAFLDSSRVAHMATSGQTRAPGEQFDLSGHACDHPGDMSLPVAHRVNCACSLIPAP